MTRTNRNAEPYRQMLATKIPRKFDRRIKWTEDDKTAVRHMYNFERLAQREIARRTGISRRMVSFIIFPERLKLVALQFKNRRKDGRYKPSKKKWAMIMQEHRNYKKTLMANGILHGQNNSRIRIGIKPTRSRRTRL